MEQQQHRQKPSHHIVCMQIAKAEGVQAAAHADARSLAAATESSLQEMRRQLATAQASGANVNAALGTLRTSLAAHADASSHALTEIDNRHATARAELARRLHERAAEGELAIGGLRAAQAAAEDATAARVDLASQAFTTHCVEIRDALAGHTRRHDTAEATLVDLAGALADTTAALGEDWANQLDKVVRAWEASAAVAHDEADCRLAELVACMEEAGVIARDAEGELSGQLDVLVERLTTTQGEMEAAVEALEVRVKERAAASIAEATLMLTEARRAAAADLGIAETRLAARMDKLAARASQDHTSAVDRCYFQPFFTISHSRHKLSSCAYKPSWSAHS